MKTFREYIHESATETDKIIYSIVKQRLTGSIDISAGTKRGIWRINFDGGEDPSIILSNANIKIEQTDSISGTYDTYKMYILKPGRDSGITSKDFALFVNRHRSSSKGTFNTKELTPDRFNLNGETLAPGAVYSAVKAVLKSSNYKKEHQAYLLYLMKKVMDNKGASITIDTEPSLTPSDYKTISKDFGEILAGLWAIKNIGFSKVHFPSAINEPLADFFGVFGKLHYPVSVKSGGGSVTSMKNLVDTINKMSNINTYTAKQQSLIDTLTMIATKPVMVGILEANRLLNTKGYKKLVSITKIKHPTIDNLKNWIEPLTSAQIKKKLNPLYSVMKKDVNDATFSAKGFTKMKAMKIGFIIGPMGHYLVSELNTDSNKTVLSELAKTITILQVNVDVVAKKIKFSRSKFKDSSFKFGWQGGAPNPNRNKIGFKKM